MDPCDAPSYSDLYAAVLLLEEKYIELAGVLAKKEGLALRSLIDERLYKASHNKAFIIQPNFPVQTFEEYFGHLCGKRQTGVQGDCRISFTVAHNQHLNALLGDGWWKQIWGVHPESTCILGPLCCHHESAMVVGTIEVVFERQHPCALMGKLHLTFSIAKQMCLRIPFQ